MLAWDPRAILDASFQMTLLSVVVIAGIVIPVAEHTFSPYLRATRNLELVLLDRTLPPAIAQSASLCASSPAACSLFWAAAPGLRP